jgi:PPOX class probable F420-dependent enzyme
MSKKEEEEEEKGHDDSKSLNNHSIAKLFEGKNIACIATLMDDGSPQITPTWVDLDREKNEILINTAKGRIKQRNASRDPRVAVTVFDLSNPYDMVAVRGKVARQVDGEEADKHIDKLAMKYLGKDKYPRRAPDEKRVLFRIKPQHVFHMKQ